MFLDGRELVEFEPGAGERRSSVTFSGTILLLTRPYLNKFLEQTTHYSRTTTKAARNESFAEKIVGW